MKRRPHTYHPLDGHPSLFDQLPSTPADSDLPVSAAIRDHVVRITAQGGHRGPAKQPSDGFQVEPLNPGPRRRPLMFISFGSGSSGNCSYIGDGDNGLLIDAGVDPRHVERTLLTHAVTMDSIKGICLTHDHSDHVCCAYRMLREHRHMRLYCTPKTLGGLLRRHNISRRIKDYHTPIYKEFPFEVGPLRFTAFDVSHDGTDNCGYFVESHDTTFAIATDLGCITDRVTHYMSLAEHIVIESNYDADMLRTGRYPIYLQARIAAERGHLDNEVTASFLAGICTPRLRHVLLCHLSHDNNTPEKALAAVGAQLKTHIDAGLVLAALPRYDASPLYTLIPAPADKQFRN